MRKNILIIFIFLFNLAGCATIGSIENRTLYYTIDVPKMPEVLLNSPQIGLTITDARSNLGQPQAILSSFWQSEKYITVIADSTIMNNQQYIKKTSPQYVGDAYLNKIIYAGKKDASITDFFRDYAIYGLQIAGFTPQISTKTQNCILEIKIKDLYASPKDSGAWGGHVYNYYLLLKYVLTDKNRKKYEINKEIKTIKSKFSLYSFQSVKYNWLMKDYFISLMKEYLSEAKSQNLGGCFSK